MTICNNLLPLIWLHEVSFQIFRIQFLCLVSVILKYYIFSEGHEKECKNLNNQIRDLDRQREAAMREVAELKVQLKLVEETRDNIRRDLIEANRRIREGKSYCPLILDFHDI